MDYKDDWDLARERFLAFWQGEILDRCCIAVTAPRDNSTFKPEEPPTSPEALLRWWLDPEDNLRRQVQVFESTYYGGEAYPAATMCLGASVMAGFYGGKEEYRPETVWYHPVITDIGTHQLHFDRATNRLYQITLDTTRYYVQQSSGKFMVSLPELGAATDDLSLLRGMEPLLYDMLDQPEQVKQAIQTLVETWKEVHQELYEITKPANHGGCPIAWMQTWAPGPHYQISCDFSAILSPQLFREIIVPEIEQYLQVNTYSVYHLDGPAALAHLDILLNIRGIQAIQWTQGEGNPGASDPRWIPVYKKIQSHGKKLILPFVEIHEVEILLNALSSRGLFIQTKARSEVEGRELLRQVTGWTRLG